MIPAYRCLLVILLACSALAAAAQNDPALLDTELWPAIKSRLDRPEGAKTYDYIPALMNAYCRKYKEKTPDTYYAVMIKLERDFNLRAAIAVGEELAEIHARENDAIKEAEIYGHLNRYYNALGNFRSSIFYIDKAVAIFEKTGKTEKAIAARFSRLQEIAQFKRLDEILPQMKSVLQEAIQNGDPDLINTIRLELIQYELTAKNYTEAEKLIVAVEKNFDSAFITKNRYAMRILTTVARGDIEGARNNTEEARKQYSKALKLSEEKPDKWREIQVLYALSQTERKAGNKTLAANYLDTAQQKAERLDMHDHLASIYSFRSRIAEEEKRFEEALAFQRKMIKEEEAVKNNNAGFDLESYYLNLEKEELAREKKNDELKLKLKKSQLNYSIYILLLLVILGTGLVVAFIKLNKKKAALAGQNRVIRHQSDQLKNLDAAKSRFFANVSHEIRTPLSLIDGPVNMLLKENQLTEKQVKLLQTASQNSKHLQRLINDILDLRKLEMGKMELHTEPTSLYAYFQSHISQFESLAHSKRINFSSNIGFEKDLFAAIDREKCRQVLYNLITNAFKFTGENGTIHVEAGQAASGVTIKVSDSGTGIHQDELPFIFEPFYQAIQRNKSETGGTGIGLSLCHEIATLLGGKVYAESEWGKGSVFYFSFPVTVMRKDNETVTSLHEPVENPASLLIAPGGIVNTGNAPSKTFDPAKSTILVVEDNPGLQEFIKMILSENYNVLTAGHGKAALEQLTGENGSPVPDMILSDLMMPVMDGFQLLEKLKSGDSTRHIPVIMLTARAEAADRLKALRIGVDDYLLKPFEEEELLVRIENLLKNLDNRKTELRLQKEQDKNPAIPLISGADKEWLENFEQYVQKNISNLSLSVLSLSLEFAMSESTLLRQLKRLTGLTPIQYLQEIRLNEARQLLENRTYKSVAQVASKVGYSDARSFSRAFKTRFGKLPTEML